MAWPIRSDSLAKQYIQIDINIASKPDGVWLAVLAQIAFCYVATSPSQVPENKLIHFSKELNVAKPALA